MSMSKHRPSTLALGFLDTVTNNINSDDSGAGGGDDDDDDDGAGRQRRRVGLSLMFGMSLWWEHSWLRRLCQRRQRQRQQQQQQKQNQQNQQNQQVLRLLESLRPAPAPSSSPSHAHPASPPPEQQQQQQRKPADRTTIDKDHMIWISMMAPDGSARLSDACRTKAFLIYPPSRFSLCAELPTSSHCIPSTIDSQSGRRI